MVDAAVGFQCPECTKLGARESRQGQLPYGGHPSRDPRLTSFVLIVINVVIWLLASRSSWGNHLGLLPQGVCLDGLDSNSYYPGANKASCLLMNGATTNGVTVHTVWVDGVASGAWWQVVTSVFTHLQIVHLALNMVSLFVIGPPLERVLGRGRFLAVYGISGLAGSATVMWLTNTESSTVGASGALFGLMGALLLLSYKARGNYQQVLLILGLNIAYTVLNTGSISWQGHLGGLIGGLLTTWIIAYAPRDRRHTVQWVGLAAVGAVVVALIALRALMLA
jgi:membrane associated rhomboid family serine protease